MMLKIGVKNGGTARKGVAYLLAKALAGDEVHGSIDQGVQGKRLQEQVAVDVDPVEVCGDIAQHCKHIMKPCQVRMPFS